MPRRGFVAVILFLLSILLPTGCSHTVVDHPTGTTTVQGGPGIQNNVTTTLKPPLLP